MEIDLHRLLLFTDLREEYLKLLERLIESYTCEAGEFVIRQDSPADYFYIILSGKVQITYEPHDGIPITVSHVEQDGLFGWSAVIGSLNYTSSAIAIEDLEAIRIHGDKLRKLSSENPEAGRVILNNLANAISSRWKDAHEQVRAILSHGLMNVQNSRDE